MKKSILVVNPNYHYSFFLVKELRKLGWRADIYKSHGYPELLLYDDDYISEKIYNNRWSVDVYKILFYAKIALKYKIFLVYGAALPTPFIINKRCEKSLFKPDFSIGMFILKLFRKKLIFFPNGCLQEVLKEDFQKHEGGKPCMNCGWGEDVCDDRLNQIHFDILNRYYDFVMANTPIPSARVKKHMIKERTLDLNIFSPDLEVPKAFKLPKSENLRILHSFYNKDRLHGGRNIKGSPYVLAAIERLKSEGYPVEFFFLADVPLKHMRYYQVQADIVVDQLIYGWWGSAAIEAMALGKPVVCYLTSFWKEHFLERFPEYTSLPVVEANIENIYEALKKLVLDKEYRKKKGRESRSFSEKHFDVKKNVVELERLFLGL